jgi:hypothetical protein
MDNPALRHQQHHFAYEAVPKALFDGGTAPLLLLNFPDRAQEFIHDLWRAVEHHLPVTDRAKREPRLSAHWLGNRVLVLLVHMPPVERDLETYFLAAAFDPGLRYFTLGRSSNKGSGGRAETTVREVTPTATTERGPGPVADADDFLEHLCDVLGVPSMVHPAGADEVREFAQRVPDTGPMTDELRAQVDEARSRPKPKLRWWWPW